MEIEFNHKIVMERKFKDKIDWFSNNYQYEIGGFIIGEITKERILLQDLILPEQQVSSGNIKFEAKNLVKMRKKHGDICLKILGEWHSHNTMGAFWSKTDEDDFINPFSEGRDLSIFIVSSEGKHLIRIELKKPINISINEIPYYVRQSNEIETDCLKDIKENVKERTYTSSYEDFGYLDKQTTIYPPSRKQFKKEINGHILFNNNRIDLINLSWFVGNNLYDEYKQFNPYLRNERTELNNYTLSFEFKNKEQAIKYIKEIRNSLIMAFEEEEDIMGVF